MMGKLAKAARLQKISDLEKNLQDLLQTTADNRVIAAITKAKSGLSTEYAHQSRYTGAAKPFLKEGLHATHISNIIRNPRRTEANITDEKCIVLDDIEAAKTITAFYSELFQSQSREDFSSYETLDHVPRTHQLTGSCLNFQVTYTQLLNVAKSLPNSKSPGPDGYSPKIFSLVPRLTTALEQVWRTSVIKGKMPKTMRLGNLKLIPKVKGGGTIDTFRPITLLNSDYKL
jgi:hypothetical protein